LVPQSTSELILLPEWQPEISLQGLEGYSHLWLVFVFHLNKSVRFHAKVHPPRLNGQTQGVFATRSPHRPNPIGLSLVEISKITTNSIFLSGADLVDGTPVLDIKPYLPHVEAKPNALGGWAVEVESIPITVEFSEVAEGQLQAWMQKKNMKDLRELIIQLIQQDPRPVVYKGFESSDSPYRNQHAMRLYDGDIHFQFLTANFARILEIKFEI
jgi:tRNA (adenine37-N6)-methyltransferase